MTETENAYDTTKIIQEATQKVNEKDIDGARMIYQSALLDWVDDVREMEDDEDVDNSALVGSIRESIATLWIEFANLEKSLQKFKAATETYESAVNCEVARSIGRVWKEYASFVQSRGRNVSAQKIYLRALVDNGGGAITNEEDVTMLWNEFLNFMKKVQGDDGLTLEALRAAVDTEHVAQSVVGPTPNVVSSNVGVSIDQQSHVAKRIKIEHHNQEQPIPIPIPPPPQPFDVNPNQVVEPGSVPPTTTNSVAITKSAIDVSSAELMRLTEKLPDALTAEWLAQDGDDLPSRPEPPLFSPSPPKLPDASGKDILGTDLSLQLIRMLLKKTDTDFSGSIVLEIARACWMMTALKEKEAAKRIKVLDEKLTADLKSKESQLESRLSVAGAALAAVEQVNEVEKRTFLDSCNQQRQQELALISWEFRHLLATQQQILTNAGVPFFNGPTTDTTSVRVQANICSFLHSSFYLRNRVGEDAHIKMLKTQETRVAALPTLPMPPVAGSAIAAIDAPPAPSGVVPPPNPYMTAPPPTFPPPPNVGIPPPPFPPPPPQPQQAPPFPYAFPPPPPTTQFHQSHFR